MITSYRRLYHRMMLDFYHRFEYVVVRRICFISIFQKTRCLLVVYIYMYPLSKCEYSFISKNLSRFRAFQLLETTYYNCHSIFYLFVNIKIFQKLSYHLVNHWILHSNFHIIMCCYFHNHISSRKILIITIIPPTIKVSNMKKLS